MRKLRPNFIFQLYLPGRKVDQKKVPRASTFCMKIVPQSWAPTPNFRHQTFTWKVDNFESSESRNNSSPEWRLCRLHNCHTNLEHHHRQHHSCRPILVTPSWQWTPWWDNRFTHWHALLNSDEAPLMVAPKPLPSALLMASLTQRDFVNTKSDRTKNLRVWFRNSCTATHSCKQANMMSSIRIEDSAMLQQHVTQNNDGKKSRLSCLLIKFLEGNCVCDLVCCYGMKKNSPSTSLQQSKLLT